MMSLHRTELGTLLCSLALGLLVITLGTGCARPPATDVGAAIPLAEDTSLGVGDVIAVRVLGEKDLTGEYQVSPDGFFTFPFILTVRAAGKEPAEVAGDIAERLKQGSFLVDPQVSVFVQQSNSKRISVLGAVAKPGTLAIIPGMTLIQAVSQAGGFTSLASKDDTVVTRRVQGKLVRHRVAVSEIARGHDGDFPLRAGDIVFVPERVF